MADTENAAPETRDELTVKDGRKITSFSASGESFVVESTEQAARGKSAEIQAEIDEIRLRSLKGGIKIRKMR